MLLPARATFDDDTVVAIFGWKLSVDRSCTQPILTNPTVLEGRTRQN